jgi:hypothetical protein
MRASYVVGVVVVGDAAGAVDAGVAGEEESDFDEDESDEPEDARESVR